MKHRALQTTNFSKLAAVVFKVVASYKQCNGISKLKPEAYTFLDLVFQSANY